MAKIYLKPKKTDPQHILVLTEKFENNFGLPEKVTDYFNSQFKKSEAEGKGVKKPLTYNYIGKYISIFFIDKNTEQNKMREILRKHGAQVADAVNQLKGEELSIFD